MTASPSRLGNVGFHTQIGARGRQRLPHESQHETGGEAHNQCQIGDGHRQGSLQLDFSFKGIFKECQRIEGSHNLWHLSGWFGFHDFATGKWVCCWERVYLISSLTGSWEVTDGWYRPEWLEDWTNSVAGTAWDVAMKGLLRLIPIFGWFQTLNSITLKLALKPTVALEFLMEIQNLVMDGFFEFRRVGRIDFEVGWRASSGPFVSMSRDDPETTLQYPSRLDIPMLFGFSVCFGLELTMWADEKKITSLEACPEIRLGVQISMQSSESSSVTSFLTRIDEPDRRICVGEMAFWTNGDRDSFMIVGDHDEPYLYVCIAGQCKQTPHRYFDPESAVCPCGTGSCGYGLETYSWCHVSADCDFKGGYNFMDGHWSKCIFGAAFADELCFEVKGTDIERYPLHITAFDDDEAVDDPYVEPLRIDVSSLANTGWDTFSKSMQPLVGTFAALQLRVSVINLNSRRLNSTADGAASANSHAMSLATPWRRASNCGVKVDFNLGVHFIWGGFALPGPYQIEGYKLVSEKTTDSQTLFDPPWNIFCGEPLVIGNPTTTTAPMTATIAPMVRHTQEGCACHGLSCEVFQFSKTAWTEPPNRWTSNQRKQLIH